ncbi:MAG: DUF2752 domain-containing protein [Spirochaetes bacterium]|nr:DUF2752 domain-containing protein [Spirochaetota bacterium]
MNNKKINFLKKYKFFLIILFSVIIFLIFIFFSNPDNIYFFPVCWFYKLTHYYCPFCGSTRAIYHLLHLDILKSIKSNILLYIIAVYFSFKFIINNFSKNKNNIFDIKPLTLIIFMILLIAYWIIRNLPYYPFNLLIPE